MQEGQLSEGGGGWGQVDRGAVIEGQQWRGSNRRAAIEGPGGGGSMLARGVWEGDVACISNGS